jgi:hypothetical protein
MKHIEVKRDTRGADALVFNEALQEALSAALPTGVLDGVRTQPDMVVVVLHDEADERHVAEAYRLAESLPLSTVSVAAQARVQAEEASVTLDEINKATTVAALRGILIKMHAEMEQRRAR